jgi:hypothetical protein
MKLNEAQFEVLALICSGVGFERNPCHRLFMQGPGT